MNFSIRGFRVNLKPSFFVMCLLLILFGRGRELCVIVFSVTMHEIGHMLMALICGIKPKGITITPIGQVADIGGMDRVSFFRRIVIVLAGPFINVVLWLIFSSNINLILFIFNMLPAYPLDGGRLVNYILGYCLGVLRANRVQSVLSRVVAMLIFALGILQVVLFCYNISLLCIGLYLIKINRHEYINMTFTFYRSVMYRNDKKVLSVRGVMAGEGIRLKTLVYRLGWDYYTVIYVRDCEGECIGSISEEELIEYILRCNINHKLRDIIIEKGCV